MISFLLKEWHQNREPKDKRVLPCITLYFEHRYTHVGRIRYYNPQRHD